MAVDLGRRSGQLGQAPYVPDNLLFKHLPLGLRTNRLGILTDTSINDHGATIKAPVLYFDGATDSIGAVTKWDWIASKRYAVITAYVRRTADPNAVVFWQTFSGLGAHITINILNTTDYLKVSAKGVTGDTFRTFTSDWAVTKNIWHSLIIQIDSTDDKVAVWQDGVLKTAGGYAGDTGGDALSGAISSFAADVPASTAFGTDTLEYFTGYIRCAGLLGTDTAITNAQALAYDSAARAFLSGASMAAYWICNDGIGSICMDQSGNDHPMSLAGPAWVADVAMADNSIYGVDTN